MTFIGLQWNDWVVLIAIAGFLIKNASLVSSLKTAIVGIDGEGGIMQLIAKQEKWLERHSNEIKELRKAIGGKEDEVQ